jgi:hypothetical protein
MKIGDKVKFKKSTDKYNSKTAYVIDSFTTLGGKRVAMLKIPNTYQIPHRLIDIELLKQIKKRGKK